MDWKIIFLVAFAFLGKAAAQFRCYACSFSSVDTDQSCLTITNTTNVVTCPFTYCVIFRQEYIDPNGLVASFTRDCQQQPDYLNHDIADTTFRTYYRACTNDLCNIGDGIQSVVGGSLSPTPEYTGQNLLVPGTGGAAILTISTLSLLVVTLVILKDAIV